MRKRIVVPLVGLVISFALPTYAQQKDVADPQTTQKVFASFKGWDEAFNNNDAAAIAAFYTRDSVFVTTGGPIIGREAIQRWYADLLQRVRPKNRVGKVDGNALHVIGTAGNEFWATGEFTETFQGKTGEPIPIKGHWLTIYVREGDDWKIRVGAYNVTPDSAILTPALATNELATSFSTTRRLKDIGRRFLLPAAMRMLLNALRDPVAGR